MQLQLETWRLHLGTSPDIAYGAIGPLRTAQSTRFLHSPRSNFSPPPLSCFRDKSITQSALTLRYDSPKTLPLRAFVLQCCVYSPLLRKMARSIPEIPMSHVFTRFRPNLFFTTSHSTNPRTRLAMKTGLQPRSGDHRRVLLSSFSHVHLCSPIVVMSNFCYVLVYFNSIATSRVHY